jgi:hypothetical protein
MKTPWYIMKDQIKGKLEKDQRRTEKAKPTINEENERLISR